MKILLCYIAVTQGIKTHEFASRFVGSYLANPPGVEHETVVACNGGPLSKETGELFAPLNAVFYPRANDPGWDLAAFIDVAKKFPCDALLCLGESCHFHSSGWLTRLAHAWDLYGPGMFGIWASYLIQPHLNTTGFMIAPDYLKAYPKPTNKKERYNAEHGDHSIWKFVRHQKAPTKLVTWDGEWDMHQWRVPPNILWRGHQKNSLAFCSHTDRYASADRATQVRWEHSADYLKAG